MYTLCVYLSLLHIYMNNAQVYTHQSTIYNVSILLDTIYSSIFIFDSVLFFLLKTSL